MDLDIGVVCDAFGLGLAVTRGLRVAGYYHNEVWRLDTITGAYAVKRLPPSAAPAVEIEVAAWRAGIPVPEPVPSPATGAYVVPIGDGSVRVHRWLDGKAPALGDLSPELSAAMGELVAAVHAAGRAVAPQEPPRADPSGPGGHPAGDPAWGPAGLEAATARPSGAGTLTMSHGDLHPKNALLRFDGSLAIIDWDTAGPYVAEQEAAGMALDWAARLDGSVDFDRFDAAVSGYRKAGGDIPAEPWVFGGWVRGYLAFLGGAGRDEPTGTLARLRWVEANLGALTRRL
ncbi:phosphotransferase [Microbispora hainanensis]|uniref:Phosphotransferase n=1 Tax=Microbispora hainanensis TaxID=568844 RepID=A0ABZ1SYA6_9ACTN|nr:MULTISPECIES: phosphotransferase [Microbispora]NJP27997.1 phosphotransferase [Microbispora sp. CL1-1]TQS10351.1 phosphotransferase [Microbispora sp. SCL1-1]